MNIAGLENGGGADFVASGTCPNLGLVVQEPDDTIDVVQEPTGIIDDSPTAARNYYCEGCWLMGTDGSNVVNRCQWEFYTYRDM
jgi:hypothetical protein